MENKRTGRKQPIELPRIIGVETTGGGFFIIGVETTCGG